MLMMNTANPAFSIQIRFLFVFFTKFQMKMMRSIEESMISERERTTRKLEALWNFLRTATERQPKKREKERERDGGRQAVGQGKERSPEEALWGLSTGGGDYRVLNFRGQACGTCFACTSAYYVTVFKCVWCVTDSVCGEEPARFQASQRAYSFSLPPTLMNGPIVL